MSDLEEIASFLVRQGASEPVIRGFLSRIRQQCERIGTSPEGHPLRPDLGPDIRIAPFERSAVIAFRIDEAHVEIVSIFYGGRDYGAILGG